MENIERRAEESSIEVNEEAGIEALTYVRDTLPPIEANALDAAILMVCAAWEAPDVHFERALHAEADKQAELLRDIFGNPFRLPMRFAPDWRSSTAVALAESMYSSRDFGPMPVLADALEEAGCDHPDVLAHCRGDGPHVRGCWVVDLILNKS